MASVVIIIITFNLITFFATLYLQPKEETMIYVFI